MRTAHSFLNPAPRLEPKGMRVVVSSQRKGRRPRSKEGSTAGCCSIGSTPFSRLLQLKVLVTVLLSMVHLKLRNADYDLT